MACSTSRSTASCVLLLHCVSVQLHLCPTVRTNPREPEGNTNAQSDAKDVHGLPGLVAYYWTGGSPKACGNSFILRHLAVKCALANSQPSSCLWLVIALRFTRLAALWIIRKLVSRERKAVHLP